MITLAIILVALYVLILVFYGMADQTLTGQSMYTIYRQNSRLLAQRDGALVQRTVNGTSVYVGKLLTQDGETYPDVALYNLGDSSVFGYAGRPYLEPNQVSGEDWDISDPYDDNSQIEIISKEHWQGAVLPLFLEAQAGPLTIEEGEILCATDSGNVWIQPNGKHGKETLVFQFPGDVATSQEASIQLQGFGDITAVRMRAGTTGTDAATTGAVIDVHVGGTTIFTTQSNRPSVDDTDSDGTSVEQTTIENPDFDDAEELLVQIDDVADGTAPTNVTVEIDVDYGEHVANAFEEFTGSASDIQIILGEMV